MIVGYFLNPSELKNIPEFVDEKGNKSKDNDDYDEYSESDDDNKSSDAEEVHWETYVKNLGCSDLTDFTDMLLYEGPSYDDWYTITDPDCFCIECSERNVKLEKFLDKYNVSYVFDSRLYKCH